MFVVAGWNGNEFFNDVYVLDLEIMAWSKPNCTGKHN
jgi:host cell factor